MAHLWVQSGTDWDAYRLSSTEFDFAAVATRQAPNAETHKCATRLVRADTGWVRVWALVASMDSNVRISGCAAAHGGRLDIWSTEGQRPPRASVPDSVRTPVGVRKAYDRSIALETLKAIIALGYKIERT